MSKALIQRLAGLSPKQRALFEKQLRAQGIELERFQILPRAEEREHYPLSFAQQRLWFLYRLEPESTVYHVATPKRLEGALEPRLLRGAVNALVARHEALRTVFGTADDLPVQRVLPRLSLGLPVVDLSALAPSVRERAGADLTSRFIQLPFVLENGPLLRLALLRFGPADHGVLINMHHIVSDGWSLGILFRELLTFYAALAQGVPAAKAPLAALPIQYPDFALWQREWLAREVLGEQLAYWRGQLAGLPVALEMPLDRPRPPVQTYGGNGVRIAWPPSLLERLRMLARQEKATLFVVLLAAWNGLLHRWTCAGDLAVGSPIAGRNRQELEGLIGFFVNTLVLRMDLSGRPTFRQLVGRAREINADANANQELPFERLVDELQPRRSMQHNPLFQVSFSFQNDPTASAVAPAALSAPGTSSPDSGAAATPGEAPASPAGGQIRVRAQAGENPVSMFDLSLLVEELPQGLAGTLVYNIDLFDRTTARRLGRRFIRLLEAACARPDVPIGSLEMLSPAERHQLLTEWNSRPLDATVGARSRGSLAGRFEAVAARQPDSIALACEGRLLSYAELDARAGRLAARLRAAGVGPETPVALALERSIEMVVAILAVTQAGGAYLPLDPAYPAERLAFTVEDSGARVVLAESELAERLGLRELFGDGVELVLLDGDEALSSPGAGQRAGGDGLAYVIYTSGSTGRPKGVQVTHANALRLFDATEATFGFGSNDVWTLFHSYAFDFSVWELWGALLYGGRLEVVPYGVSRAPDEFRRLLSERRVTVLNQTPSAFRQLIQADRADRSPLALRWVVFGGEALEFETLRPWYERHPDPSAGGHGPRLVNMYGITETTVHVTERGLSPADLETASGSVIGVPIADLELYTVDPGLRPVAAGTPGELVVGGAGLARGYLGRPALTAERFVPDPFSGRAGTRLYRSGDLARHTPGGALIYLGRIDHQVKVRGFRIELGEIEAALLAAPEVREAVVLAREDEPGITRLAAYLVLVGAGDSTTGSGDEDEAAVIRALRERLGKRLPDYMVPAFFVPLAALPLTPNGKIDRRALPAPVADRTSLKDAYAPPRTPTETALTTIWQRILGVERVGIDDAFFELGGDSILALQMISRAARAGIQLRPRQIFQHPTIRELAGVAETIEAVEIDQGPVAGPLPLTPIQRWFFAGDPVSPHHFNQAVLLAVPPSWSRASLATALAKLADHHDALRLRFAPDPAVPGGWRQWNAPPSEAGAPLRAVDLSRLPAGAVVPRLAALAGSLHASLRFDGGPLLRALHARLPGDQPGRLLLVAHHLLVDGVSWRILVEDLEHLVRADRAGEEPDLPPKTTSYQAWSKALAEAAREGRFQAEAPYWDAAAEAGEALPRELDAGARDEDGAEEWADEATSERVSLRFSSERTGQLLRDVPPVYRTRINDLLLAAFAGALRRWSGGERVKVDLESHGREPFEDHLDLSRTVGWFTTIAPVALDLRKVGEPGALLKAVKEQLRQGPESPLGYGVLRYLAGGEGPAGLAPHPAAEISFNYLGQLDAGGAGDGAPEPKSASDAEPDPEATAPPSASPPSATEAPALAGLALAPESTGRWVAERQRRRYRLAISGQVTGGRLTLEIDFSRAQYRRQTMERLLELLREELDALVDHCLAPGAGGFTPSDFPLAKLGQEQLDRLVADYPTVQDIYPLTSTQQGMLFYGLFDRTSAAYTNQTSRRFRGDFQPEAFQRAWQELVDHHEILRACFRWEELAEPLQIIQREATIPWELLDWRDLAAQEQDARLERYTAVDRAQGFELTRAPVMRLALIRLADDAWFFNWSYHHILLDGWSVPLLRNEVSERYVAHCLGIDPGIAPERPFSQYMRWLGAQDMTEAEAFWRRELAGFDEPISLGREPATTKPKREPERFASQERFLSRESTGRLRDFAGQAGVTLNTVTQAAWAITLARLSGRDDVVFGTTVSGRSIGLDGMEGMLGPFINTLASRARIDRRQPILEWARGFQEHQVEARQFEHTPVNDVQRWSEVPVSRLLFESIVVFENYPEEHSFGEAEPSAVEQAIAEGREESASPRALPDLPGDAASESSSLAAVASQPLAPAMAPAAIPAGAPSGPAAGSTVGPAAKGMKIQTSDARFVERTSYPLTLVVVPKEVVLFSIGYDLRVFDELAGRRMIETLRRVLEAIAADPRVPIGDIPLLGPGELAQVLRAGNQTATPFDPEARASDLIRRQAAERPDAIALEQGEVCLSYGELARRVAVLAAELSARLAKQGKRQAESRVALWCDRSPASLVALLAVLEAGSAYVPIDPKVPPARVQFVLEDSSAAVLLTTRALAARLAEPPGGVEVVWLDEPTRAGEAMPSSSALTVPAPKRLSRTLTGDSLAYVIYTSGSTGTPKGVMISQRSLAHFALTSAEEAGIGPGSRVLQFASLSFDTSVEEIFPCLCAGGRLVLRDDAMLRFDRLLAGCADHRVEVLDLPTAYWHELTAEMERTGLRLPDSIRLVILGGEKALAPVLDSWKRLVPSTVALVNTYGPTEATVVATRVPLVPDLTGGGQRAEIPIGGARPNCRAYVLDPHLEPVPISMPGELWLGGEGLARGYLDRPGLTAEHFQPDPYGAALEGLAPGGRLYRTGDRVRFREAGLLEFLGRIDQQVKVRGFRIELGEIEAALVALPGVREAVVVPFEREGEPLRLAAYLAGAGGEEAAPPEAVELKRRLAAELPEYMVPHWIVPLEALPKSASGKIDRRALPEPLEDRATGHRVPPRTETERVMVEIWQELFHQTDLGVEASFFDLGGDSLLALRLMSRVQNRLGRDLPLALLFEKGTLAELAAALSDEAPEVAGEGEVERPGRVSLPLVAVQPRGEAAPFFCVHPAGGNVLCYSALGRALGTERPFYGLQAPGLERERQPIAGVEALARHYVRAVRRRQPRGPYHLGGWSTGGVVAFEMARQLEAAGEAPASLVLFDTLAPREFPQRSESALILAFAGSQEVHFPAAGAAGALTEARFRAMALAEQLALIAERRRQAGTLAVDSGAEEVVAQWRVFAANVRSLERYEPTRYGATITCFRAAERGGNADTATPWSELAAALDVVDVPGNHESMMFPPHVQVLGRRLRERLAR